MNERDQFPPAPTPEEHAASMREAIEAIRAAQRAETGVVGIIPRAGAEYADEIDLTGKTAQAQRNRSTQLAQVKRRNAQRRANREAIQRFVAEGEYVEDDIIRPRRVYTIDAPLIEDDRHPMKNVTPAVTKVTPNDAEGDKAAANMRESLQSDKTAEAESEPTFRDLERQVHDLADAQERPEAAGPIRLLGHAQRRKNVTPTAGGADSDAGAQPVAPVADIRKTATGAADYRFLITAVRAACETRPAPERYMPPRPNARTCTNRHGDPKAVFGSFDEAHEHAIGHTTERAHAYRCEEHGWHIGSNRPIPG